MWSSVYCYGIVMSAQRKHGLTNRSKEKNNNATQQNQCYKLQTVSEKTLPILKEVFLTLTPGQRPLKIWVFIANITNEFILGLGILHAYDTSGDLQRQTLRLAEEKVSLQSTSIPAW
jgi:hypothetical protein